MRRCQGTAALVAERTECREFKLRTLQFRAGPRHAPLRRESELKGTNSCWPEVIFCSRYLGIPFGCERSTPSNGVLFQNCGGFGRLGSARSQSCSSCRRLTVVAAHGLSGSVPRHLPSGFVGWPRSWGHIQSPSFLLSRDESAVTSSYGPILGSVNYPCAGAGIGEGVRAAQQWPVSLVPRSRARRPATRRRPRVRPTGRR